MGAAGSMFMTEGQKEKLHARMTVEAYKLDEKHVYESERFADMGFSDDTPEVVKFEKMQQLATEKFLKKWKRLGLPLKENGDIMPAVFKNY